MERRSLQLAAGILLLVGLLGLSTALIAEVREEVTQRSQEAEDDPVREIRSPSGLPVPELTLLDPAQADLPDRERVDDGLRATGPGRIHLEPGDGIQPGSLTLGDGTELILGEGWDVDDEDLTCTASCELATSDGDIELPPNTTLIPPSSTGQFGAEAGLQPGVSLELPRETELELPPVHFPSGTALDLRAGAHAELPGEADRWASLLATEPVRLPAGTVLTRSSVTEADPQALGDLLDQARQQAPAPGDLTPESPRIEVTETPERIQKGEPFAVKGQVLDPEGEPLSDHPVTVFANATKDAPGIEIQIEATQTDVAGTFTASARLPETEPTRPYHILAHAHPRPDHDPPLTGAWSDPLVPVEGEANLTLDLPERAGTGVPLPLQADLLDAHGAAIPDQTVLFTVDGTDHRLTARTGLDGQAHVVLPEGLPFSGNYTIQAAFPGTGNITADDDEAELQLVHARIDANATHQAPRGEPTEIAGRVSTESGDPGRLLVQASYGDDITAREATDDAGRFTLELPVPADLEPGDHTVTLTADAIDAKHRLVLTATAGLLLDAPSPGPQPVGAQAPIPVEIRQDNGTPLPGVSVEAHVDERVASRAVTDARGQAQLTAPIPHAGDHHVQLRTDPPDAYRAQTRNLTLTGAPLEIEADLSLAPGRPTNGTLRLTVDDQPLAQTPVELVGPGTIARTSTDADGVARMRLEAPEELKPGLYAANLTLPAYQLHGNAPMRILESPELSIDVIEEGREGRPVRLAVSAEGEQGPLEGVPLIARAHGAFDARDQAITDENGTANLTLAGPDGAEGALEIDVLARSTPDTARNIQTASAEITAAPLPWGWLLAGLAAVGLAGAAALRHRERETKATTAEGLGPTISLRLAEQTPGDPPVWHPGEPTELIVELVDDEGHPIPGTIHLEGPPGERRLELGEDGRARTPLPAHSLGTHTYRARFEGDRERAATETVLDVRITDYREEIDRAYRQLHRSAARYGLVGPDATPRELAEALGAPADELARSFERYDYSPQPVDRSDYERFMQLRREADPRA